MLSCAIAQGGLITFLLLVASGAGLPVAVALLVTPTGALLGRIAAGHLVDRRGWVGGCSGPGLLLAAAGMAAEAGAVTLGAGDVAGGLLLVVGAGAVGVGFGLVQNDALTALFAAFGSARYGAASATWNIAFDAGTGLGALALGAVAEPFGYGSAFALPAVLCGLAACARNRVFQPRPGV